MEPQEVIFVCRGNSARSVIAMGIFNQLADGSKARASSAGSRPAERVKPRIVELMTEEGIDVSHHVPHALDPEAARHAAVVMTMGCEDAAAAGPNVQHWAVPESHDKWADPGAARQLCRAVRQQVEGLLMERAWMAQPPPATAAGERQCA